MLDVLEASHRLADKRRAENPPQVAGSQSVYRAVAVLRGVARNNASGVTASILAGQLELNLATTHRLLKVLSGEGLITFDPYSKKYHVGLELYVLGVVARDFQVRDLLASVLERIRNVSRETVFLLVRSGADALCLERLDGDFPIRALTLNVGSRRPLGVGAGGLALLSAESDEVVQQILSNNARLYSDYAEFTSDEILNEVVATRARGFSLNDGRLKDAVRAVGITVGPEGAPPVAAVSIATGQTRMEESRRQELEEVLKTELKTVDWRLLQNV